jgi:hypothetical protein
MPAGSERHAGGGGPPVEPAQLLRRLHGQGASVEHPACHRGGHLHHDRHPPDGAGSLCTVRHATGGVEPEGRREPWREQRRTPEGSAPQVKGSPPPRSAHQRRTSKGGEPGPDPWRGAAHGGACGSGAHSELSESGGSEHPERLPSDTSDRRFSGLAISRSLPKKSPRVIDWNHPWGEGPCMPSASAD